MIVLMQESSKIPNKCLDDANPTQTVLWYQMMWNVIRVGTVI